MIPLSVARELVEINHPYACPPQWLPVLLAMHSKGADAAAQPTAAFAAAPSPPPPPSPESPEPSPPGPPSPPPSPPPPSPSSPPGATPCTRETGPCAAVYDPVCGPDGVTYSNLCAAWNVCQSDGSSAGGCPTPARPPHPPAPPAPPPSPALPIQCSTVCHFGTHVTQWTCSQLAESGFHCLEMKLYLWVLLGDGGVGPCDCTGCCDEFPLPSPPPPSPSPPPPSPPSPSPPSPSSPLCADTQNKCKEEKCNTTYSDTKKKQCKKTCGLCEALPPSAPPSPPPPSPPQPEDECGGLNDHQTKCQIQSCEKVNGKCKKQCKKCKKQCGKKKLKKKCEKTCCEVQS